MPKDQLIDLISGLEVLATPGQFLQDSWSKIMDTRSNKLLHIRVKYLDANWALALTVMLSILK